MASAIFDSMTNIDLDDERQILLSLVQDSEGKKSWSSSLRGWSGNSRLPICEWQGITCRTDVDGGGADGSVVTGINLTQTGMSGTIPTELGLLTDLEVLNLGNNMLRGSIPQEVADLKKLKVLDLTKCFLTGTLPQRFESPYLTKLLLADNAISGRFFEQTDYDEDESTTPHYLQSLEEIRMENNLLTGTLHGPSISRNMPHLEILSLSDNDLSGLIPGELGSLSDLHYLYLDSNHLVGPLPGQLAQAGRASSILELWLQDNALSGTVPASYARFDDLHDFFIDGNKLTGALPPGLCRPQVNANFFAASPAAKNVTERNYCDSIACPAGSVALEGMYPCTVCPGGEASRLKNRYLGQTGRCSDHSQREILEMFHDATNKGGPWSGVSDWKDKNKPVCRMTGITCDDQNHVVEISLKNRNLQGHLIDQLGSLSFLEVLDVSDNALMGYVPGDLRWTSLTRLDVSGNKLRGAIPPLLCRMEELNGNGKDDVLSCDRLACPVGTSNEFGFYHGVDGEVCRPCYDDSPYIAQKSCAMRRPPKPDWKETVQTVAKQASNKMGVSTMHGLAIAGALLAVPVVICWLGYKRHRSLKKQRELGNSERDALPSAYVDETESEEIDEQQPFVDNGVEHFRRRNSPRTMNERENMMVPSNNDRAYPNSQENGIEDDYSFRQNEHGHSRYRAAVYRDFGSNADGDDLDYASDDDTYLSWARPSAADLVKEHRGIALNKRERFKRAISERLPAGGLDRRARETASAVNIGARRRWHAHIAG